MKLGDFEGFLQARTALCVPFHDLDPTGMVWHGRYFKYFETARCELLERIGYSYADMKDSGYIWPVVDTQIRYVHSLTLDQAIQVTACLKEWEFRMTMDYLIEDETGRVCTRASTVQVPVLAETMELQLGSPPVFTDKVTSLMRKLRHGQ